MKTKRLSKYDSVHEKATKQRSITPDTYKESEFQDTTLIKVPVKGTSVTVEDFFYIDNYQHKDSKTSNVSHFGINTYNDELIKVLEEYNITVKKR